MHIGHIYLVESFNSACEQFVKLIESLQKQGLDQFVIVRNVALAERLDAISKVTVGPVVRSPVTAYCLMPEVDVVHLHDRAGWQAGLLLTLTKSIPFVLTRQEPASVPGNALTRSILKRASGVIDQNRISVAEHLRIYRRAADSLRVPTMLL